MSEINLKHEFNVHLDSVRGVQFIGSLDCMASVSEDCTVKLWDVKLMHKNMSDGFGEGIQFKSDPYFTLRGHTGPLFKITGSSINDRIIYTAGNEGIVRIWKVPDLDDVDIFGPEQDKYQFCLGSLNGHNNEPIWDLKHHPSLPLLLSMGADDTICLWRAYSEEDESSNTKHGELKIHENLLQRFHYETPTCCDWLYSNLSFFVVSFTRDFMVIYDHNSGQMVSEYKTVSDPNKSHIEKQINSFVCHPTADVAITGTEDGTWAIYNLSNTKCVKQIINAHDDGISCVALSANKNHFYTGSHDGKIKFWDMRNYKCFGEIKAHEKKYDEAVMSMIVHPNHPVLVTCGADASIKWFETDPTHFPSKRSK